MKETDFIIVSDDSFLGRHPSLLGLASWFTEKLRDKPILTRSDFDVLNSWAYQDIKVPLDYQAVGRKALHVE